MYVFKAIQRVIPVFLSMTVYANSHHPQDFLNQIAGSNNEGEQIVKHFCISCHASKPLIPIGAPRKQNIDDWEARVRQGADHLFQRASEGFNAMPPRGGCFECSDKQLVLAILEMLPEKIKKDMKNELLALKKNK
ncbi:cytochrome c5 family protein [Legionella israelensis]|uniref:Cytochrome c5 family protein n=1 Tax=Legionella israelensis TaxID=454 RepID=A0AAX1EFT6_9GAMM|nr:cytochrome c5 family protein [Legionella israelensis]